MSLFTFDESYDREMASDGRSRYGAYLRQHTRSFTWDDGQVTTDAATFVRHAWEIAQSPIMSPAFLGWDEPRLQSVDCTFGDDDGGLVAVAKLAVPRPQALEGLSGFQDWDRGGSFGDGGYYTPEDRSLGRRPALLTSTLLRIAVPPGVLYEPVDAPEQLTVRDAKQALRFLADFLEGQLRPILDALNASPASRPRPVVW